LFKLCIEDHYNHCSLNTFYIKKIDCRRDIRYYFFTYNGAYTMPHSTQRKQVGGTISTLPATGLPQAKKYKFSNKTRSSPKM
jgi:hypothetical protein